MPRTRWSPERDAPLLAAVFDPAQEHALTPVTRAQVADVRAVFVGQLKWSRERLAAYRFRVLASVARREPQQATVLLRPPADIAVSLPGGMLEQQLAHMSGLGLGEAQAHFHELFERTPEVIDFVNPYRINLSDADYKAVQRLGAALGAPVRAGDARNGNPDLSRALARIIEVARERLE